MNDKWAISHEVGHVVMFRETGKPPFASGYYYNLNPSPPPGVPVDFGSAAFTIPCTMASHNVFSREWNSVADLEGFGSFWAAIIWNNVAHSDCVTYFSGTSVNCRTGSGGLPTQVMTTNCFSATVPSFAGQGNETDWQRVFWALVDSSSSVPQAATVAEVIAFVKRGAGFSHANHYAVLQAASDHSNTPSHLESRWDTASVAHGINY